MGACAEARTFKDWDIYLMCIFSCLVHREIREALCNANTWKTGIWLALLAGVKDVLVQDNQEFTQKWPSLWTGLWKKPHNKKKNFSDIVLVLKYVTRVALLCLDLQKASWVEKKTELTWQIACNKKILKAEMETFKWQLFYLKDTLNMTSARA